MRSLKAAMLYPGRVPAGILEELLGGARDGRAVRTDRRGFHRGPGTGGVSEQAADSGSARVSDELHATDSNFKGVRIEGVRFVITNRENFDATRLGLEMAAALQKLYPGKIDFAVNKKLIGSDDVIRRLQAGETPNAIQQSFMDPVAAFVKMREGYLLYR